MEYKGIKIQTGVDTSNKHVKTNEQNERYYLFDKYPIKEEWVICSSQNVMVFLSYKPYLPLHLLIVPFQGYVRYSDYSHELRTEVLTVISFMERLLAVCFDKPIEKCSFQVSLQDGVNAGQTVGHCHFHLNFVKEEYLDENSEVYKKLLEDGYIKDTRQPFTRENLLKTTNYIKSCFKKLDL